MELSAWIAVAACALSAVSVWIARGATLRGSAGAKTAAGPPTPLEVLDRLDLVESKVGSLAREQIAFIEEAEVILAGVERKRKQRASIDARNLGGQPDLPLEAEQRPQTREEQKAAVRERMGKTTH